MIKIHAHENQVTLSEIRRVSDELRTSIHVDQDTTAHADVLKIEDVIEAMKESGYYYTGSNTTYNDSILFFSPMPKMTQPQSVAAILDEINAKLDILIGMAIKTP